MIYTNQANAWVGTSAIMGRDLVMGTSVVTPGSRDPVTITVSNVDFIKQLQRLDLNLSSSDEL